LKRVFLKIIVISRVVTILAVFESSIDVTADTTQVYDVIKYVGVPIAWECFLP